MVGCLLPAVHSPGTHGPGPAGLGKKAWSSEDYSQVLTLIRLCVHSLGMLGSIERFTASGIQRRWTRMLGTGDQPELCHRQPDRNYRMESC